MATVLARFLGWDSEKGLEKGVGEGGRTKIPNSLGLLNPCLCTAVAANAAVAAVFLYSDLEYYSILYYCLHMCIQFHLTIVFYVKPILSTTSLYYIILYFFSSSLKPQKQKLRRIDLESQKRHYIYCVGNILRGNRVHKLVSY